MIFLRREETAKASALIDKATLLGRQAVIRHRVVLIRGDLATKQGEYSTAIRLYQEAVRLNQHYGGEAYELDDLYHRLGFAYLAQGDLTQAEAEFEKSFALKQGGGMIELIRGKYGLARVAQARGEIDKAIQLARQVLGELSQLQVSHRLLKQITDFLRDLEAN